MEEIKMLAGRRFLSSHRDALSGLGVIPYRRYSPRAFYKADLVKFQSRQLESGWKKDAMIKIRREITNFVEPSPIV